MITKKADLGYGFYPSYKELYKEYVRIYLNICKNVKRNNGIAYRRNRLARAFKTGYYHHYRNVIKSI